jgi:hypothetical protein
VNILASVWYQTYHLHASSAFINLFLVPWCSCLRKTLKTLSQDSQSPSQDLYVRTGEYEAGVSNFRSMCVDGTVCWFIKANSISSIACFHWRWLSSGILRCIIVRWQEEPDVAVSKRLHCISQKTVNFLLASVRTWNLILHCFCIT